MEKKNTSSKKLSKIHIVIKDLIENKFDLNNRRTFDNLLDVLIINFQTSLKTNVIPEIEEKESLYNYIFQYFKKNNCEKILLFLRLNPILQTEKVQYKIKKFVLHFESLRNSPLFNDLISGKLEIEFAFSSNCDVHAEIKIVDFF